MPLTEPFVARQLRNLQALQVTHVHLGKPSQAQAVWVRLPQLAQQPLIIRVQVENSVLGPVLRSVLIQVRLNISVDPALCRGQRAR